MFDWIYRIPLVLAGAAGAVEGAGAATEGAVADPGLAGLLGTFVPMIAIVAVFYFLMIRPQRKKDKKVKEMLSNLKTGDRICTIGGIYGTIKALRDDDVTLLVGRENTEIVMARWAIRNVEAVSVENEGELLT